VRDSYTNIDKAARKHDAKYFRVIKHGSEARILANPTVSVLIPTYNRACFLAECLESILGQTFPPKQIIVINDGSTDNIKSVLEPYKARIEYIEKENGGKSSALNLAMSRVIGDYVWVMDDDDVALPDALQRHIEILEQRPEVGFTYSSHCLAYTRPDNGRIIPGPEIPLPHFSEDEFFIRLMERNFLTHAGIVVRTSCYRKVGPFNTDLTRSQDYEMALRLGRYCRSEKVSGPTFYERCHDGFRGSAADVFEAGLSHHKWREYDQRIFRTLREELSLKDYLPRRFDSENEDVIDKRRVYIQRMSIMAMKGLYGEMVDDLRIVLADKSDDRPLSEEERVMICRLMSSGVGDDLFCEVSYLKTIGSLCQGYLGRQILLELTRGVCRRARHGWRRKAYRQACKIGFAVCYMLDMKGMNAAILHKVKAK